MEDVWTYWWGCGSAVPLGDGGYQRLLLDHTDRASKTKVLAHSAP
jgi:hypothetical protein